jgi:hypothetical protein
VCRIGPRRLGQRIDGRAIGVERVERAAIARGAVGVGAAADPLAVADLDAIGAVTGGDGVRARATDDPVGDEVGRQRVCERRADRALDRVEPVTLAGLGHPRQVEPFSVGPGLSGRCTGKL